MAKNILIVPNRSDNNSSPYITFENTTLAGLNVLSGATVAFSANSVSNVLSIQPSNLIISAGTLNVRNYLSVGGIQVVGATNVWSGSTSGLTGSQGATGNTGGVGAQGPIGAQGNTGAQGSVGTSGDQGNLGAQGNVGPQGGVGAAGGQGTQGTIGPQGGTGTVGGQGSQGTKGGQGAQGGQGNTGAATGVGPQGAQGPKGGTGPATGPGPTGAQGGAGGPGGQGAQGTAGGGGGQGAQGGPGAGGNTGAQGTAAGAGGQGAQGTAGGAGGTGGQGSQGAAGPTGARGSQGAAGAAGGLPCTGISMRVCSGSSNCTTVCAGTCGALQTNYSKEIANCTTIQVDLTYIIFSTLARCEANTTAGNTSSRMSCGGKCGIWGTTSIWSPITTCSDVRLKESIQSLKDSLDKIMKLDVVEYDWNDKVPIPNFYENLVKNKKIHSIGLIAQNVRKYFPEIIGNNKGYYSINYEKLNAVLVEAIKEQHIFIEDIDKELNFIKSKLN